MPRLMLIKPLAAMLAPTLLVAWLFAAPAHAGGASCKGWNTDEFFKRATAADVSRCLKAGANPNARIKDGRTPLHVAAAKFSKTPAVAEALLAAGADPAAEDKEGKTPWHHAKENAALKETEVYWRLNAGRFG